jgi:hypothetical protein
MSMIDFDLKVGFVRNTTGVEKISYVGLNTGANEAFWALSKGQNQWNKWWFNMLDSVLIMQPCLIMDVSSIEN